MFLIAVDIKMCYAARGLICDGLFRQIDFHKGLRVGENGIKKLLQEVLADDDGKHEVVQLIVFMYIGKKTRHDNPESIAGNRPRRVFTARAAAEILSCHQNLPAVGGVIQYEVFVRCAVGVVTPIAEQIVAESLFVSRFQEAGGDDLVGIDILQREGHTCAGDDIEFLFHLSLFFYINVLGSVITPVIAAAAAVSGLARRVREPGPCRPSKLRLDVDTAYFPAGILSSFIARQAEHPG